MKSPTTVLFVVLSCLLVGFSGCANQPRYLSVCPCGPDWMSEDLRCAVVPQECAGANFRPACSQHDLDYEVPGKPRKESDCEFLDRTLTACGSSTNPSGCRATAYMLFLHLRLFGALSYWQSQP
jgi:hypothetical protein